MSLGTHLLLAIATLLAYLLVLCFARSQSRRRSQLAEPLLFQRERSQLQQAMIDAIMERLQGDPDARARFIASWLDETPKLAAVLTLNSESNRLARFLRLWIEQQTDERLLRGADCVNIITPAINQARSRHQEQQTRMRKLRTYTGIGLAASLVMLIIPPWHTFQEHRVRALIGTEERTIVDQQSEGYRWCLASAFVVDKIEAIPTQDFSRLESRRTRTEVDYLRLTIQLVLTLLVFHGLALRRQNDSIETTSTPPSSWQRAYLADSSLL